MVYVQLQKQSLVCLRKDDISSTWIQKKVGKVSLLRFPFEVVIVCCVASSCNDLSTLKQVTKRPNPERTIEHGNALVLHVQKWCVCPAWPKKRISSKMYILWIWSHMCVCFFWKDRPSHKFLPRFSLEHGMDQQTQGRSKSFATTTWLTVESCQRKGTF